MNISTTQTAVFHLRQRLAFEELLRRRRASDHERYIETFRRAAVDPNPHQVEAVSFALTRLADGGAMLCDEVGLGKTIETGLLLTQMRAEGRIQVLIVVPVSLSRQWQVELRDLFGLKSAVLHKDNFEKLDGKRGIFIVGREFAGSPQWGPRIAARGPWDLVVIDEAHEFLSTIYKRFSRRSGNYNDNLAKGHSRRAGWLKKVIGESPAILLTATPLQNSLFELWGLAHFVDRTATALGGFDEFCTLFTQGDGRSVKPEMENELRNRLKGIVCRTLRSQAQPFLKQPFTARHCKTINFHLEAAEKELYHAVSDWLSGKTAAYRPRHQKLMTLMIRRRMGSSVEALASTLSKLRERLEGPGPGDWDVYEDVDLDTLENDLRVLVRLEQLARKALAGRSPKLERLGQLLKSIEAGTLEYAVGNKLVVFTESRRTLEGIVAYLHDQGYRGRVTAFSGTNDTPEALAALERWEQEVGRHIEPSQKPEGATAMRGALVHEFKTRTQVLVATEAGAKGLNLQFCNCLVNFDLPWNPQRVEQRIGRVHRYGQKHDVMIVNFINLDNEGEQRVYELLKEKLGLFEGLFGASDEILGRMVSVLDFESRVVELLSACRSPEEQQREFDRLALELDDETRKAHDEKLRHAESLIASLDDDVKERLRLSADALPVALSRRDETVIEILNAQSDVRRLGVDGDRLLLEWSGRRFHLGPPEPGERCGEPLNLDHPMMQSILRRCRQRTDGQSFICSGPVTGRWSVYRVEVVGVEEEERILVVGTTGLAGLREVLAQAAELRVEENADSEQGLALALARLREEAEREQGPRLERALNQLEARKQDVRRVLEYREEKLRADLAEADKKRRLARSNEDSRKALAKHRKVQAELDALMRERDGQIREASRRLSSRQQELRSRRYVEATPTLLFRLRCEGQG